MSSAIEGRPVPMVRLSAMMFLQFFIWGAWYVTVGNYMNSNGMSEIIYWAYTVGPIAAIASPFFLGMIADRFFATERVLGTMHILAGIAMFIVPYTSENPTLFIIMLGLHMLCYMPTLGLTNSLAFHNTTNQEKQFPIIRVFGTIGWIVAGWIVSAWLQADMKADQFYVTGGACLALGVFSFFLPHTPPPAAGKKPTVSEIIGLDALRQLSSTSFWVFLVSSFLICIPLAAYYNYAPVFAGDAGFKNPAFYMSFGQVAEIVFMLLMPIFFAMLGVKWMLLVGMAAWVVRYGLFAGAASDGVMWMVFGGILLHGICYDFFFVTGFIYTDKKSTAEVRGQAQGLLVLVTQGLGMLIGAQVIGRLVNGFQAENHDELLGQAKELRDQYATMTESVETIPAEATSLWNQATELLLQAKDWQTIWLIPCIMAAIIMVVFFIMFRDDGGGDETPGASDASAAANPPVDTQANQE